MVADEPEELARREVERDVRLAVCVDDDQVVALVGRAEERARVGVVHRQPRVLPHPEVALPDAADRRVELDAVDLRSRVVDTERTRRRPGRVAEDRDPLERTAEERRERRGTCPTRRP